MIEKASATIGLYHGLPLPVLRLKAVAEAGMERGAGAGAMLVAVRELVMIAGLDEWNKPVPVQQGHVVIEIGQGMPAQEMVMEETGLARRIVVANIVVIDLRYGNVDDAENHERDSQSSRPQPVNPPLDSHRFASMLTFGAGSLTVSVTSQPAEPARPPESP